MPSTSKDFQVLVISVVFLSNLLLAGCSPQEGRLAEEFRAVRASEAAKKEQPVRVRKNVKSLTDKERKEYVKAVLKLKKTPSPYAPDLSYYDQFVAWHRTLYTCDPDLPPGSMPMGHGGPLFLPWHRQYLLLFEDALREVSGREELALPYWDWTDPESTAAVFQEDFMGGDGDPAEGFAVTSGPFRKDRWILTVQPPGWVAEPSRRPYLTRRFGTLPTCETLPGPEEVRAALDIPLYDVAPYDTTSDWNLSFRNHLEGFRDPPGQLSMVCAPDGAMILLGLNPPGLHNQVHGWVSGLLDVTPDGRPVFGTMGLSTSPNDPLFFLHHAYLDRLWAQWQERHGTYTYLPTSGFPGNNVDDMLMPFHEYGAMATPGDLEDISALGYRYE